MKAFLYVLLIIGCLTGCAFEDHSDTLSGQSNTDNDSDNEPNYDALHPKAEWVEPIRGCSHIFVYQFNENRTEAISFAFSRTHFQLSPTTQTFDLATMTTEQQAHFAVKIDAYATLDQSLQDFPYCQDSSTFREEPGVWTAVQGTVSISLSQDVDSAFDFYQTSISASNLVFLDPTGGNPVNIESWSADNVSVGGP